MNRSTKLKELTVKDVEFLFLGYPPPGQEKLKKSMLNIRYDAVD